MSELGVRAKNQGSWKENASSRPRTFRPPLGQSLRVRACGGRPPPPRRPVKKEKGRNVSFSARVSKRKRDDPEFMPPNPGLNHRFLISLCLMVHPSPSPAGLGGGVGVSLWRTKDEANISLWRTRVPTCTLAAITCGLEKSGPGPWKAAVRGKACGTEGESPRGRRRRSLVSGTDRLAGGVSIKVVFQAWPGGLRWLERPPGTKWLWAHPSWGGYQRKPIMFPTSMFLPSLSHSLSLSNQYKIFLHED